MENRAETGFCVITHTGWISLTKPGGGGVVSQPEVSLFIAFLSLRPRMGQRRPRLVNCSSVTLIICTKLYERYLNRVWRKFICG